MTFEEMKARVTGLGLWVVSASWTPTEADVTKARRVIAFLEDRRVLYAPYDIEFPEHCVHSVLEIRKFLTDEIGAMTKKTPFSDHLRAMRAACRKFLDQVGPDEPRRFRFRPYHGDGEGWDFSMALGELRAVFGVYIALIAAQHGLPVEGELAKTLPPIPRKDDGSDSVRERAARAKGQG